MPPVMMTKVHAIARTPFTAVDCRIATRLSACMKFGEASVKNIMSASRLAKASSFCRVAGLSSQAFRPNAPSVAALVVAATDWVVGSIEGAWRSGDGDALALGRQLHDSFLRRLARGDLSRQTTLAHHQDAMAHAQDLGQLAGDHDDRLARRRERMQQLVDFTLCTDVDAPRGLVEEQDIAVAQQPFGNHELLLVAAG